MHLAGVWVAWIVGAGPAGALQVPVPSGGSADAAVALESARSAQARFERERARWVGDRRVGGGGGSCDEVVGRICMRFESGSDWWWPEHEDGRITAGRQRLLDALGDAARVAPDDPWILGQRVVYLGEAGRWHEAAVLARSCAGAEPSWCAALEGLALHGNGQFVEAEAAFERALATMEPAEARRWRSVELLLDAAGRSARRRAGERGDTLALERFWRLSDPLFLVPGNDRYTEHLARRTVARTRENARSAYALSWGADLEELLIRYGWEVGWERVDPPLGSIGAVGSVVGHHDPRGASFVAPASVWDASADSDPVDWNPGSRTRPRSGHTPAYAPVVLDLEALITVLPRGDSALLVVRIGGVPPDTTLHSRHEHPPAPDPTGGSTARLRPRYGLFAAPLQAEGPSPPLRAVTGQGTTGSLVLGVPAGRHVVSVEVWDPGARRAGRSRQGLEVIGKPRDVATLSELLLAEARGPLPESLDQILDQLVAIPVFQPGDTLRVAWETTGLGWHLESLRYDLSVEKEAGGLLTRLGRGLGVIGDPPRVGLAWAQDAPPGPGPAFTAVDLVLPVDLSEGEFRVRLVLESSGRAPLVVTRMVRVRVDAARR